MKRNIIMVHIPKGIYNELEHISDIANLFAYISRKLSQVLAKERYMVFHKRWQGIPPLWQIPYLPNLAIHPGGKYQYMEKSYISIPSSSVSSIWRSPTYIYHFEHCQMVYVTISRTIPLTVPNNIYISYRETFSSFAFRNIYTTI